MIIRKMVLHNFGIYAGTNTFDFESEKPVILIGGMNGRGKTTFLESVLLALYGRRSFAFSESKLSYSDYLKKLVNISDGSNYSFVEIEFVINADSGDILYQLKREWEYNQNSTSDLVSVTKNHKLDEFLSNNWEMYIEEIIPSAISSFFFFDGEKISKLAVESTGQQMRNSIKMLLGIDVLDRLEKDIHKIIKQKNVVSSEIDQKEIDALQNQKDLLDRQAAEIYQNISSLNNDIPITLNKLEKAEANFLSQGGRLSNSKEELLDKQERYLNEIEQVNEQIFEIAAGDLPLLMVQPLLEDISDVSKNEFEQKTLVVAAQKIEELFTAFAVEKKSSSKGAQAFVDFVKSNSNTTVEKTITYDLSNNAIIQLSLLCGNYMNERKVKANELKEHRKKLLRKLDEIENYLLIDIDEEATHKTYHKIKALTQTLGELKGKKQELQSKFDDLESQITVLDREISKKVENSLAILEQADDDVRITKYSNYALNILNEYRLRLQKQKVDRLAAEMTNCYKKLASKSNLIDQIKIDASSLNFVYYNKKNQIVAKNKLSAGEKQLMVFAMLWSFALCSNHKLPVIIDTPLARLDSAHRENLIKNYFPNAGDQTIILSTDSEIGTEYHKMLKPSIGKEFTLDYDDQTQSTHIISGFFGGERK